MKRKIVLIILAISAVVAAISFKQTKGLQTNTTALPLPIRLIEQLKGQLPASASQSVFLENLKRSLPSNIVRLESRIPDSQKKSLSLPEFYYQGITYASTGGTISKINQPAQSYEVVLSNGSNVTAIIDKNNALTGVAVFAYAKDDQLFTIYHVPLSESDFVSLAQVGKDVILVYPQGQKLSPHTGQTVKVLEFVVIE